MSSTPPSVESNPNAVLPPILPQLIANIQQSDGDPDILSTLNALRIEAKGNDRVKSYIGEQIGTHLVRLGAGSHLEVALGASKLLRSITVYRKNKLILQTEIGSILDLVQTAARPLQIPLAAVIWNLSSLRPNRDILMQRGVLKVLNCLLKIEGEVQNEAAGATRNLTLDERYLGNFADTEIIDTLVEIIPSATSSTLMTCVLVALRNLSSNEKNQEKMGTSVGIANMIVVLKKPSTNPSKDIKYVLETLVLMSTNIKVRPILADSKIEEALLFLIDSPNDFLSQPCKEILNNLKKPMENKPPSDPSNPPLKRRPSIDDPREYFPGFPPDDVIKAKDIILKKVVGEGAFGSVYLGEYHGYPVAVKVIKVGLNRGNASKVLDELKLMRRLKHPNVVLLMGACLNEENQIMIVTEFASRGDLKHCLNDIESLAQRIRMLQDVITGLHWLQAYNIVHRDLKLDNLLVAEDYTVKITDFGLSIENDGQTYSRFGGNIKYSAPEILRERFVNKNHNYPYGERTDVYSFGLIWWQILTKKNPFMDRPAKYPGKEGLVKFILEGHRPPLPKHWPESLKNMISACWAPLQSKRPSFRQILDKWEKLTLDLMCPDTMARVCCGILWKDQKAKKSFEEVKKIFLENCMTIPKLKEKDTSLLSSLLCESAFDDTVSFARFCYAVGWFGPLDKSTNCAGFFNRIRDLHSQNFFHGFMSDSKSEQLLSNVFDTNPTPHPHYLLKYSLHSIGEFKIAYIDKNRKINYVKIHNVGGSWRIGQSPKICENWKRVKTVCKQVLGIGSHVPKKKIL